MCSFGCIDTKLGFIKVFTVFFFSILRCSRERSYMKRNWVNMSYFNSFAGTNDSCLTSQWLITKLYHN